MPSSAWQGPSPGARRNTGPTCTRRSGAGTAAASRSRGVRCRHIRATNSVKPPAWRARGSGSRAAVETERLLRLTAEAEGRNRIATDRATESSRTRSGCGSVVRASRRAVRDGAVRCRSRTWPEEQGKARCGAGPIGPYRPVPRDPPGLSSGAKLQTGPRPPEHSGQVGLAAHRSGVRQRVVLRLGRDRWALMVWASSGPE